MNTQQDDDWAYDRARDEQTIDDFLRQEKDIAPDESNVY